MLNAILRKFDVPHKIIHGSAEKVTQRVHDGKVDEAHERIDCTAKNELTIMVGLFADIKTAMCETKIGRAHV